jgi:hypothetical protein
VKDGEGAAVAANIERLEIRVPILMDRPSIQQQLDKMTGSKLSGSGQGRVMERRPPGVCSKL